MSMPGPASGGVTEVDAFAAFVKPVAIGACLAATLAIEICAKRLARLRVGHSAIGLAPVLVFGFVLSFSLAFFLSLTFVRLGLVLISPWAFMSAMTFSCLCRGIINRCNTSLRQSRHWHEKESNSAVDHELVEQLVQRSIATNVWADPTTSSLRREHK